MEKHKLDELKELLDKYDLYRDEETSKIRVVSKSTKKTVNLSNENMRKLMFAFSWARAFVEAGCYDYDTPVQERKIPGFDEAGKKLYDDFFKVMTEWAHKKDFHHYIDHFRMADLVHKISDNEYASRIVFQLLRPDRLDTNPEFHELFETGRMTTEMVNKDEMVRLTYKYILNEAGYTSEKGLQPGE